MKIVSVTATPMSAPVPEEKRHRTDLGTKVKSDATLIRVETDNGLTGIGAALGSPPIVAATVAHELAPECVGEDPMFSERIFEKMYNGSRARPSLERGVPQPDESRRRGVIMEAIAGVDIAVWDAKAQALGVPLYQALGAARSSVRGYASGGWAPGDEAETELGGYAAKGFTAAKMRVAGRDGFSIPNCVRRVRAARRGIGPDVELMVDAHGSLEVATAIKLAKALEEHDIAWFEEPRRTTTPGRRRCSGRRRSPSPRARLSHPGGDAGPHADDVGAVRGAVRHQAGRDGARAAAAWAGLHLAEGRAGAVPLRGGAGV
ncbi:MAG: hypothetical protein JOY65_05900, partial [Acetobacteraceae bacterium]|nr:hypothetical protein [Acetobacteraceae bacterium]